MSDPAGTRRKMLLTVLPDAARVEDHVVRRAAPFVPGPVACTFGELERDVVRAARASGACGRIATPEAVRLPPPRGRAQARAPPPPAPAPGGVFSPRGGPPPAARRRV